MNWTVRRQEPMNRLLSFCHFSNRTVERTEVKTVVKKEVTTRMQEAKMEATTRMQEVKMEATTRMQVARYV